MLTKRKDYFDYLRIICAFGVILGHVCDDFWSYASVNGATWKVFTAYLNPCHSTVPVFFMISGALFLDQRKPIGINRLYKKYIPRMLVTFFIWSTLYALTDKPASVMDFMEKLVSGHYHMWFILALVGCYMVVPFLRKITESEQLTKYFLLLSFMFLIIVGYTLPLFEDVPVSFISSGAKLANKFFDGFSVRLVLGYPFYMVLGYYLDKKEFSKKAQVAVMGVGVLAYVIMVVATIWWSVGVQTAVNSLHKKFSPLIFLLAAAVFVFGKYVLSGMALKNKGKTVVRSLSKYTLGVYLVHVFVLDFVEKQMGFTALSFNPVIAAPCVAIVVYMISLLISAILNKIPLINKYMV